MSAHDYTDIKFEVKDRIGTITFNRPKVLNSFGGNLIPETVNALRVLNEHPDTIFTVLTGEGRFFSAGADIRAVASITDQTWKNDAEKKIFFLEKFAYAIELLRSMIDHRKVLILTLNGPAVGGGAAWFPGIADIVLASNTCYLQCPFSALGLVPENGSALSFAQSIGVHRANDFLMFGRQLTAQECEDWGLFNRVFESEGAKFQEEAKSFLRAMLEVNDGKSMIEMKRLQNAPMRDQRFIAVINAVEALAERFVEDAPKKRFEEKRALLESKRKAKL